jgi:hypothetical protein
MSFRFFLQRKKNPNQKNRKEIKPIDHIKNAVFISQVKTKNRRK